MLNLPTVGGGGYLCVGAVRDNIWISLDKERKHVYVGMNTRNILQNTCDNVIRSQPGVNDMGTVWPQKKTLPSMLKDLNSVIGCISRTAKFDLCCLSKSYRWALPLQRKVSMAYTAASPQDALQGLIRCYNMLDEGYMTDRVNWGSKLLHWLRTFFSITHSHTGIPAAKLVSFTFKTKNSVTKSVG